MGKKQRKDAAAVIRNARQALINARHGVDDLHSGNAERRVTGVHNIVVFGRSVTIMLQQLRSVDPDRFESWYDPYVREMENDPLMRWAKSLRNDILKAGQPELKSTMTIARITSNDIQRAMRENPPPPGVNPDSFFVGDTLGGSGWMVKMPNGDVEKYYVSLPEEIQKGIKSKLHFPNPPVVHLGRPLTDTSLDALMPLYVKYLDRMVSDANRTFNSV